jgi:hypothetical protein
MKLNSKKNEIRTKCVYSHNFQYKTADEGKSKGACRNVPLICGLCPVAARKHDFVPAVWRYNMGEHLRSHHAEYASPQQPEGLPLPYDIWKSMEIKQDEEIVMGVKAELIPRPFTEVAPAVARDAHVVAGGEPLKKGMDEKGSRGTKRVRDAP